MTESCTVRIVADPDPRKGYFAELLEINDQTTEIVHNRIGMGKTPDSAVRDLIAKEQVFE
jgi:hypothetical protein